MSKLTKWLDFNHKHSIPIQRSKEHFLAPFYNFQQGFDNLFRDFYSALPLFPPEFNNINISPPVDIIEDESSFKVEVEMSGVDEKDIKVSISDHILNIKASKETSKKDTSKNYVMREIAYGSYERNIPLPENADIDRAESTFTKGMLLITLPKKAHDKSKVRELEVKKT